MSNKQQGQQVAVQSTRVGDATPTVTAAEDKAEHENPLAGLTLQLARILLKLHNAHCKCSNCPKIAIKFVTANEKKLGFGTREIALCDTCELTPEFSSVGTVRRITDSNLLETIQVANALLAMK